MRMPDIVFRLIASDRFADAARVAFSLLGVAAFCFFAGQMHAIVALMLGVIACALAETDDTGPRRLASLGVTLICFAGTSLIVEILNDWPILFALGLVCSTFSLSMLGAVGPRWGSVATATLILAVYTMIGMELGVHNLFAAPAYLTMGAAWYGLFSLGWSAVAPGTAVRHTLAGVFVALAHQIASVARLFEPYRETDYARVRLDLADANAEAVAALNTARRALIDRLARQRARADTQGKLQLYFTAQDIHERIHSAHYPHEALAEAFFHSDLLFRCGHLLHLQADVLRRFADALHKGGTVPTAMAPRGALADVEGALDAAVRHDERPSHLVDAVRALIRNVGALQDDLDNPYAADIAGQTLQNPDAATVREAAVRIFSQLTIRSALFRHAVRLSVGLLAGYLVLKGMRLEHGFWILLTTLLVSQPSYGATRKRLIERIAGTVTGVVVGWAALQLFPAPLIQLPLIVVAGTGFFVFRRRQYPAATAMITLFVILSFEQILSGYAVIGPRLFDTLVGVAISFLTLCFVLPDWRVRRLKERIADMLAADSRYLEGIIRQYRDGRIDDLAYRIVRRDAHNAHAAFENLIRDILGEPARTATKTDNALRTLRLAHALLSHLSALGAHRKGSILADADALKLYADTLAAKLRTLGEGFVSGDFSAVASGQEKKPYAAEWIDLERLFVLQLTQIDRICCQLVEIGPKIVRNLE